MFDTAYARRLGTAMAHAYVLGYRTGRGQDSDPAERDAFAVAYGDRMARDVDTAPSLITAFAEWFATGEITS